MRQAPILLHTRDSDKAWSDKRSLGFSIWRQHISRGFAHKDAFWRDSRPLRTAVYGRHAGFCGRVLLRKNEHARASDVFAGTEWLKRQGRGETASHAVSLAGDLEFGAIGFRKGFGSEFSLGGNWPSQVRSPGRLHSAMAGGALSGPSLQMRAMSQGMGDVVETRSHALALDHDRCDDASPPDDGQGRNGFRSYDEGAKTPIAGAPAQGVRARLAKLHTVVSLSPTIAHVIARSLSTRSAAARGVRTANAAAHDQSTVARAARADNGMSQRRDSRSWSGGTAEVAPIEDNGGQQPELTAYGQPHNSTTPFSGGLTKLAQSDTSIAGGVQFPEQQLRRAGSLEFISRITRHMEEQNRPGINFSKGLSNIRGAGHARQNSNTPVSYAGGRGATGIARRIDLARYGMTGNGALSRTSIIPLRVSRHIARTPLATGATATTESPALSSGARTWWPPQSAEANVGLLSGRGGTYRSDLMPHAVLPPAFNRMPDGYVLASASKVRGTYDVSESPIYQQPDNRNALLMSRAPLLDRSGGRSDLHVAVSRASDGADIAGMPLLRRRDVGSATDIAQRSPAAASSDEHEHPLVPPTATREPVRNSNSSVDAHTHGHGDVESEEIAERVWRLLTDRLAIEQERRGVSSWH